MFALSLKVRILREFQKVTRAEDQRFSERELLALELIENFSPITEKGLAKVFGIAFSSVSDLVHKLIDLELIDSTERGRGKPLELTPKGRECLQRLMQSSSNRYGYLLDFMQDDDFQMLENLFDKMDKNAAAMVQKIVFDRYSADGGIRPDPDPDQSSLS